MSVSLSPSSKPDRVWIIRSFLFLSSLVRKVENYAQVTVIEIDSFIFQIVNKNSLFTTRYNLVDHEDFSISKKIFHVFLSACVFVSVQCNRKSIFDFVLVSNTKGNE